MPFKGEIMTCAICEKSRRSNRRVASQWAYIRLNRMGFYVCPDCIGGFEPVPSIPASTLTKVERTLGKTRASV